VEKNLSTAELIETSNKFSDFNLHYRVLVVQKFKRSKNVKIIEHTNVTYQWDFAVLSSMMEVDWSSTRGERRGMGSLLVKKEFNEDEVEAASIEFCAPLQAKDFISLGFIWSGHGALFWSLLMDLLNTNSSLWL